MKVFLRTYGCRANHYDSEVVRAMVIAAGGEIVESPHDADVAVFNSCAVTSAAVSDLRAGVRRAARARDGLRSVVMGCASALEAPAIGALPGVSHVVAGADVAAVARALEIPAELAVAPGMQSTARALLRVQDGCDEHCTFCATTLARGANRSRALNAVIEEASRLADHHAELVITGVHIGSYGRDIGSSLGALVERLVGAVPRVRIRLSSVEATEVDERLCDLLRDANDRVAPHLHAPLQSGSDRLLRRMGRHWYTADSYAEAIERIAGGRPVFGLGADVITGFPGETDDDHRATLALVERLPFSYLHVFPFSPRQGTAALRLPDAVDPTLAKERAAELRGLAEGKGAAYVRRRDGGAADVIVTSVAEGKRQGMTEDYLSVLLPLTGQEHGEGGAPPRGSRLSCSLQLRSGKLHARPLSAVALP